MKILQVIEFFTPLRGGSVIVPYNISKQLAKNGHDVTILTTDFEFDKDFAKSLENVTVIPFRRKANLSLFLYSPDMKNWLKNNIENFDIIHLHNFRSYQNMKVSKYAKKKNIPYILQAHGSLPYNGKTILKKLYDKFYGFDLLQSAKKCIALNETEKNQYQQMGINEKNIEIIPNGIDLSEYENLPERGIFRKKYGITEGEKIILYLGRLHKSKGIDLLIKAFADLLKELNSVNLVIVGPDDGYKSGLEELVTKEKIGDKVKFTGFVTAEVKKMAFVDADVFVTPRYSGFPVTFPEACACGVPLITTNYGDRFDWIHEKVGYIVEYDKNLLKKALSKILIDHKLQNGFKAEGRRLALEEFNWDKIVKKFENVYLTLM